MTLSTDLTGPAVAPVSLRERKKQATRRTLRLATLDLVAERGFARVTIEDIAEAAGVSPRTFFNYFPTKEAALFGAAPDRIEALRQRLILRMPGETALDALRVVLVGEARARAGEISELGGDTAGWLGRMKGAQVDAQLRAAMAAHMAMVERIIAEALAERLGTDPRDDPYPALLASVATAVLRTMLTFWANTGGAAPLDQLTDIACQALAGGLREDCTLRQAARRQA